ncbi:MAG: LamG-like jellyroll fold domain-containing protein [Patescibacteria group bacterium]
MRTIRHIHRIAKTFGKKLMTCVVLCFYVLFSLGAAEIFQLPLARTVEAATNPAANQYMISIGPVTGSTAANYVYATIFNPATSTRTISINRMKILANAVAAATYQNLTIRRITSATVGTGIDIPEIVKKNNLSASPMATIRHTNVTVAFAGTADSRMNAITAPGVAGSNTSEEEMLFDSTEPIVLKAGEGIALYQEAVGDADQRITLNLGWEETTSTPTALNEYILSFPRVEVAAVTDYKYATFFNPASSGKSVLVKRLSIDVDADTAAIYTNSIYIRRITAASAGTQILAANIPEKHNDSATSIMDIRHTGVTATLAGTVTESKIMEVTPPAAASEPVSHFELLFATTSEYIVLSPGEGLALVSSATGDIDQVVRLSVEWAEQTATPTAQGEYILNVGPVAGNITNGYNYVSFFNPAASGKHILVKRIIPRVEATTTAVYVPLSIQRIGSATGGTQITAANVPKKASTSATTIAEIRYGNPTVVKSGSGNATLLTLTTPGAVGQQIAQYDLPLTSGDEYLVLAPGEGIALFQSAAGDIDMRVKLLIEWKEQVGAPTAQGEYLWSTGSVAGSATNPYQYVSFFNPSGSGKTILLNKIGIKVDAVAAATYVPIRVLRISAASAGTAITASDLMRKSTSSAVSVAQVRIAGPTVTLTGTTSSSLISITSPGAAPTTAAPQLSGHVDHEFVGERLVLQEGQGITLYQDGAGDTDFRVKVLFDWKEQVSTPTSQKDFMATLGTLAGSAGFGHVYASLFNPLDSGKQVVVKRILMRTDAAAAAAYVPMSLRRITAASGGTLISTADIPKKHTDTASSSVELRRTGVTVTMSSATTSRLFSEITPAVAGQAIGGNENVFGTGYELALNPGEGIALYQESTGDVDHRVQMKIVWSETGVYSLSGTLYSDEGSTQITTGGKVIKARVDGFDTYSTTTLSGSGFWTILMDGEVAKLGKAVTVWVDGDSTTRAVTVTKASTTANLPNIDLYRNRVTVKHEGTSGTSTTITDFAKYDADNDSDIPFTANSGVLNVFKDQELFVYAGKVFAPGGPVTIHGNASSTTDGSIHIDDGASIIAGGAITLAGSWLADAGSTFVATTSGEIIFNATTTGKTIAGALTGNAALGTTTFNGVGGAWTFSNNASTTGFVITNGTVTAPPLLTVLGSYLNNGTFNNNSGTIYFANASSTQTISGTLTGSSAFSTVSFIGSTTPVNPATFVGHWKFDEGVGTDAADSSGTGNAGTLTNGPTWTTGQFDGGLQFDGTDDYVDLGNNASLEIPFPITFSVWINQSDFTVTRSVVSTDGTPAVYAGAELRIGADRSVILEYGNNGGLGAANRRSKVSTSMITSGAWTHVVGVVNGFSDMVVYVDGVLETGAGSYSGSAASMVYSATTAKIGAAVWGGSAFLGSLDDVRIYNRALTSDEVTDLYTSNSTRMKQFNNNASTTNIVIDSNSKVIAPSSLTVSGNYTNNGIFSHNGGTTTFNGTSQQTLSGNMVATSSFSGLQITNNSGSDPDTTPSVIFASAASSTYFTATTPSTKLRFAAGEGYTFTNMWLNGQAAGTRVQLRSSVSSSPWKLFVSAVQSVFNTNPKDSDASGGDQIEASDTSNLDGTGNSNWNFGGTVTCSSNITSTTFSALSLAQVETASPNATTTFSCGSGSGCSLSASSAGDGVSPGLATTSPAYLIPSLTATLSAGTEGYGIQAATSSAGTGSTLAISPTFLKTGNDVGGLAIANSVIASSTSSFSSREVVITHKAAIAATTPVGNYVDTITYSCLSN